MPESTIAGMMAGAGSALMYHLWLATLLVAISAVVLSGLRHTSARIRYTVAYTGLLLTVLAPLAAAAGGATIVRTVLPYWAQSVTLGLDSVAASLRAIQHWWPWMTMMWIAGVMTVALRIAGGWQLVRRQRADTQPLDHEWRRMVTRVSARMGVDTPPDIVSALSASMPCVTGWLHPVLILPVAIAAGCSPGQADMILAHELAHVRRRDFAMNVIQMCVEAIGFYHPGVWWLSARARHEREACCDELVVATGSDPIEYAQLLATLEGRRSQAPVLAMAGGPLLVRVRHLVAIADGTAGSSSRAWVTLVLGFAMLAMGAALATMPSMTFADPATWTHHLSVTTMSAALLGAAIGVRHALEPDHVVTMAAIVSSQPGRSAITGATWGAGHSLAVLTTGASMILLQTTMPAGIAATFELMVAVMLMALGARALIDGWQQGRSGPDREHSHRAIRHRHRGLNDHVHVAGLTLARRPLYAGLLHGLAGSGVVTTLVMSSLSSVPEQLAFLVVFGFGSTAAMAALTACANWPLVRIAQRPVWMAALSMTTGTVSIAYGLSWALQG